MILVCSVSRLPANALAVNNKHTDIAINIYDIESAIVERFISLPLL
jgi:hypothetical protein